MFMDHKSTDINRSHLSNRLARLAQSVERQALNLVVEGSSPSVGDFISFSSMIQVRRSSLLVLCCVFFLIVYLSVGFGDRSHVEVDQFIIEVLPDK